MNKLYMLILVLILTAAAPASSQFGFGGRSRDTHAMDLFQVRFFSSAIPEKRPQGSIDLFIQLANDVLTFIRSDSNLWQARYEIEVIIYRSSKEIVAHSLIRDTVTVDTYEMTNSRTHSMLKSRRFYLQPGEYTWRIKLLNAEGLVILEREDRLQVPEYDVDKMQMSDLLLVDSLDCSTGQYRPNLRGAFTRQQEGVGVIFQLYPPRDADSVRTYLTLTDLSGQKVMARRITRRAEPLLHFCIELGKEIERPGEYLLQVRATAGASSARMEQKLYILWGHAAVPSTSEESMDLAIKQLSLIAKGSTIREMERAQGEERERLYSAFWQKRDPTPDTPENELKEEFFMRIDFANRQFSEAGSGRQGWRTDRGRIHIQNGPPDQIEKQAGEMGMASTEIWSYNRLKRRYIFVDRQNNGDFRLIKID